MPKIKVDIMKFVEIRESSESKAEIMEKGKYPAKTVDYYLRLCNQNGVKFSKALKRNRNGIPWDKVKEHLRSIQK